MRMKTPIKQVKPERDWIKLLGFALSIGSLVISAITLYRSNLAEGELQIFMPDQIAVLVRQDRLLERVSIPFVIYNTGAPNNWKTIENMTVAARIKNDSRMTDAALEWTTTSKLLSNQEYEHLYPELKNPAAKDYLIYESRKLPFSITGRQTVNRIYDFEPAKPIPENLNGPLLIDLSVDVTTVDTVHHPSKQAAYCLPAMKVEISVHSGTYQWAVRVSDIQARC